MASFDLVCKLDMGEFKNALEQTKKQVAGRYDFKGSKTTFELKEDSLEVLTEDEYKAGACLDILRTNMGKRGIGMNALEVGEIKTVGNQMVKQVHSLKQGIDKETGKKINKLIKESKIKVSSSYMDEKVRINGKKIDDLQSVFKMLQDNSELNLELQMENMKR
ncbi:MAG: YajQ family cyclic di-GMP-binding protein [Bacteriovoracaceae bacterium]